MRFKTDENIHPDAAAYLRQAGHDAVTVWDEALRGSPDAVLAEVCRREGRALITLDLDFADIRAYPPERLAGVIVLRLARETRRDVLAAISRLLPTLTEASLTGHLWIVDEHSIRVRGSEEP